MFNAEHEILLSIKNLWFNMKLYTPLLAILLVSVVFASGCTQQNSSTNNDQTGPIQCTDPQCLYPQFMACNPSEMKIPFNEEGITYVITVFGAENGKCHYALKVVDKDGNVPTGGPTADCKVPIEKITEDTFGHLFGSDSVAGKESIKIEQDKLEADYCTKQ